MTDNVQQDAYQGAMDPLVAEDEYNALYFMINQIINGKWTLTLGQVQAVRGGGVDGPPTVDVQPMVGTVDGYGNITPQGIIYNLPSYRLQGGSGGVISDPENGDIGLLATASRDISSVIRNKAPSGPGSRRTFDPADGLFLGGFLGAELAQYLRFTSTGLQLVDKNGNSIETSAAGMTLSDCNANKIITAAGFVNIVTPVLQVNGVPVTVP
jgi:hypothetical protein